MADDPLALLGVLAAPSRRRILALVAKGVDHPEELAKRLKLRRQGIDKQLMQLYDWGLVERGAILSAEGRPRIIYRISERGQTLLANADALVTAYGESMRSEHESNLAVLEDALASGELDEEAYVRRRKELDRRYARFSGGTKA